jgi:hypothetical protein
MTAPTRIWIPIDKATVDKIYMGYQDSPSTLHFCEVKYVGNGVGHVWEDPDNKVEGITHLLRYTTFQEQEEWYKKDPIDELNLYGLFNDTTADGAYHEMYNVWVAGDFYELNHRLKEEGMALIGIAAAPYKWHFDEPCCAYVAEYKDTGERIWCHGFANLVEDMREAMKEEYAKKFPI